MSMRKIYRELAKKHGVSVKEVREDMQAALTEAYTNPLKTMRSQKLTRTGCRVRTRSLPRRKRCVIWREN